MQEIRCGFSFMVLHAGNLGFYGEWNTLLKAAGILQNENIGLVFVGEGANLSRAESELRHRVCRMFAFCHSAPRSKCRP